MKFSCAEYPPRCRNLVWSRKADALLSPLGKLVGSSDEQTWIPIPQGCFVSSLVEIVPVDLQKKVKMWKVHRRTDRHADDRIRKADLSFQLIWAKQSPSSFFLSINAHMWNTHTFIYPEIWTSIFVLPF